MLDADVSSSTRTGKFGAAFPERFFNVGVAESNMADVAAGLATAGYRPVISTFALFLALKATDQIRNVICYNNLPVVILGGYAGLSDSFDGASHQAITDLAVMRALPNMRVVVPADGEGLKAALADALEYNGPTYIRACRNPTPVIETAAQFSVGRGRILRDGTDCTVVAAGVPVSMALEAAESLSRSAPVPMEYVGVKDTFTESGPYDLLLKKYRISSEAIVDAVREVATRKSS